MHNVPVSVCPAHCRASRTIDVAIIGGGPAGLMAAETAVGCGAEVTVFDAMASVGRKLLIAGKGGLNLTYAEPITRFLTRYGSRSDLLAPHLQRFTPERLREWAASLGIATVIGSSGRVFPADYKAAPLLRRWLHRLRVDGVRFAMRHRWQGWADDALIFQHDGATIAVKARAVILALGGASWPRLGSDGAWCGILAGRGIPIAALKPSNCGFEVAWSSHLRERYCGHPVKSIAITARNAQGEARRVAGEFVLTDYGFEGGPIYTLSPWCRDALERGRAFIEIDLAPGRDELTLARDLAKPRGARSLATHLRRVARIQGVKAALLRERLGRSDFDNPAELARAIKALPVELCGIRPLAEAISTAGGVLFEALDPNLMVRELPGVFCAGEMADWEAPTGGYLLTACLAMGRTAGAAAANYQKEPT